MESNIARYAARIRQIEAGENINIEQERKESVKEGKELREKLFFHKQHIVQEKFVKHEQHMIQEREEYVKEMKKSIEVISDYVDDAQREAKKFVGELEKSIIIMENYIGIVEQETKEFVEKAEGIIKEQLLPFIGTEEGLIRLGSDEKGYKYGAIFEDG